jgi:hypothetical protein
MPATDTAHPIHQSVDKRVPAVEECKAELDSFKKMHRLS